MTALQERPDFDESAHENATVKWREQEQWVRAALLVADERGSAGEAGQLLQTMPTGRSYADIKQLVGTVKIFEDNFVWAKSLKDNPEKEDPEIVILQSVVELAVARYDNMTLENVLIHIRTSESPELADEILKNII